MIKINEFGQASADEDDLMDLLYQGKISTLDSIYINNDSLVEQINQSIRRNADNIELARNLLLPKDLQTFDRSNQEQWLMPQEYKTMDMEGYLVHVCPKENYQRLMEELRLFKKYNMMDLLRYLKYLVDVMRENNVVWGVGRGSSVASYTLFLLGIHKIDSIKYKRQDRQLTS